MLRTAHDSVLGKIARTLFSDEDTQYTVDPNTGKTVATRVKRKPGQIFRDIVAGALLGGLAGSQSGPNAGFLGGMAAGGSAEFSQQAKEDQLRRQQAEQQFKDQNELATQRNTAVYHNAQIAMWNAQQLRADRDLDLHNEQFVTDLNNKNQQIAIQLAKAGAKVANVPENGIAGNGPKMMQAVRQNPELLRGPSGTHRVWIQQTDFSGLEFGEDGRWVDAKTGKPVDLSTRTAWTAYDIDPQQLKQSVTVSGKDLNKLGFNVTPGETFRMSMSDFLAMQRSALSASTQQSEFRIRENILTKRDLDAAKVKGLQSKIDNLYKNELYKNGKADPAVQSKIDKLQGQLDGLLGVQSSPSPNSTSQLAPGQIPAGAHVAENSKGQRIYSTDGKSWFDAQTHKQIQ